MDDKNIMATILGNLKGGCDLMMHGSIESNTANVQFGLQLCAQRLFEDARATPTAKCRPRAGTPPRRRNRQK